MPELESLWLLAVAGGPLVLGAFLAYGALRGRRQSRAQMAREARPTPRSGRR